MALKPNFRPNDGSDCPSIGEIADTSDIQRMNELHKLQFGKTFKESLRNAAKQNKQALDEQRANRMKQRKEAQISKGKALEERKMNRIQKSKNKLEKAKNLAARRLAIAQQELEKQEAELDRLDRVAAGDIEAVTTGLFQEGF